MVGIVAYGAYVPRLRLNRQAVYDANKWFAAGLRGLAKGERSMANWDEDSITMAVEASRDCLTSHKPEDVRSLYFASTTHPFKDRQNAGVIGTALSIEQNLLASDVGGSQKAGTSALIAGLNASKNGGGPALVALAACKLKGADITHFIMPSLMPAVPKQMAKICGIADGAVRDLLGANLGDTGAAHALVMLVDALETAKEGDKIMVVAFGQGVDTLVFEVTAENAKLPKRKGLSGWLARRKEEKNYLKFLAFNEMLPIEKGMRAEFDKKTALSVLWRKRDMIYGLVGGKCKVCGTVQFPRSQVCVNPNCHAIDSQEPYGMAGLEANVMSFTADSLVYSPDPPGYYGMITFPEGGRFMADFTDSDKDQVKVGAKMRMTFRMRDNDTMRGGFKRYFWKAAPV